LNNEMQKADYEKKIKILLADDHSLFREGLRRILGQEKDIEIVAEARDGAEALRLANRLKPDVVLMDISLPGRNGIRITRKIKKRQGGIHVIMLSMYEDTAHIIESFQAGASGYVIKTHSSRELIETIRSVFREGVSIPPSIEQKLLKGIRQPDFLSRVQNINLTNKEVKILKIVASGSTNKEIARRLFISEKTVKNHLNHIYRKLGVKNRAQAVVEGLKRDYISQH